MEYTLKPGYLEAILDQFKGRKIAFAAVTASDSFGPHFGLGIAEGGVGGYTPVPSNFCRFDDYERACEYADGLNANQLGLVDGEAPRLILSTMRRTLAEY